QQRCASNRVEPRSRSRRRVAGACLNKVAASSVQLLDKIEKLLPRTRLGVGPIAPFHSTLLIHCSPKGGQLDLFLRRGRGWAGLFFFWGGFGRGVFLVHSVFFFFVHVLFFSFRGWVAKECRPSPSARGGDCPPATTEP